MDNLKKFVAHALESLSGLGFIFIILYCAVDFAYDGGFWGFIWGIFVGFISAIIIFGAIFLLMDINQKLDKLLKDKN